MGDERYVQVRERAVAYAAWYEKERVTAHITENCREEAKQILAQADRLMAHTFSFEDRWDMEPCREPFKMCIRDSLTPPCAFPCGLFMPQPARYFIRTAAGFTVLL